MSKVDETPKSEAVLTMEEVQNKIKESYMGPFSGLVKEADTKVAKYLLQQCKKDTGDAAPNVIDAIKFVDDNVPGLLLPVAEENYLLGYTQGLRDAALSVANFDTKDGTPEEMQ